MRELEASLQQFGEFLLKAQLARPQTAPYFVRWVRRFLSRPASDEPLTDQVRGFCEELERNGGSEPWQVRQADQALRIYFVNFLKRTEWHQRPASTVVDEQGSTSPLAALDLLRTRLRTRHYSYRTECTYLDWVRRFLSYAAEQQGTPQARVTPEVMRDYLAHLAVHRHVSASTQNQACSAILFLCREVLGVDVENLSPGVRAKRGERLPVVLSMPETMGLLEAMSGTARLMATLIYGGGLRVTECCELRIKDVDFDQELVFVRSGKGNKDRSTLFAEVGRDDLRAHLREVEAQHHDVRRHGPARG
ncbi:MAG: phage integrase N-terminal SAM-like domain-containing protein [Vicinamibacterales bacterium]